MRIAALAIGIVVLSFAPRVLADEKQDCAAAYTDAQSLQDSHKLLDARAKLRVCSQSVCAPFMRRDCTMWLEKVEASIPSVVLVAQTSSGDAIVDASVTMDGTQSLTTKIDGRALDVDPGQHEFTFTTPKGERAVVKAVISEGEHAHRVVGTFETAPVVVVKPQPTIVVEPVAPTETNPLRTVGLILGGVGAVTLVTGGVLGIVAAVTKSSSCTPDQTCTPGTVGTLYGEANAATATIVIGSVLVASGVVLVLVGHPHRGSRASLRISPMIGTTSGFTLEGVF